MCSVEAKRLPGDKKKLIQNMEQANVREWPQASMRDYASVRECNATSMRDSKVGGILTGDQGTRINEGWEGGNGICDSCRIARNV